MKWVECEKEQPPFNRRVLCAMKNGAVRILARKEAWSIRHRHDESWQTDPVNCVTQTVALKDVLFWVEIPLHPQIATQRAIAETVWFDVDGIEKIAADAFPEVGADSTAIELHNAELCGGPSGPSERAPG